MICISCGKKNIVEKQEKPGLRKMVCLDCGASFLTEKQMKEYRKSKKSHKYDF